MTVVLLRGLSLNSGGWMRCVLGTRPAGRWGSQQRQAQEAGSLSHPDASATLPDESSSCTVLPPSFPYRASGPDPSASNDSAGDRGQRTFLSSRYSCPGRGREGKEEEGRETKNGKGRSLFSPRPPLRTQRPSAQSPGPQRHPRVPGALLVTKHCRRDGGVRAQGSS